MNKARSTLWPASYKYKGMIRDKSMADRRNDQSKNEKSSFDHPSKQSMEEESPKESTLTGHLPIGRKVIRSI